MLTILFFGANNHKKESSLVLGIMPCYSVVFILFCFNGNHDIFCGYIQCEDLGVCSPSIIVVLVHCIKIPFFLFDVNDVM